MLVHVSQEVAAPGRQKKRGRKGNAAAPGGVPPVVVVMQVCVAPAPINVMVMRKRYRFII